jgi:hypothetical protein
VGLRSSFDRHSGEGRNPALHTDFEQSWIPVFAGMTSEEQQTWIPAFAGMTS